MGGKVSIVTGAGRGIGRGGAIEYGSISDMSAEDEESFDFWHPDNFAPLVAFLCSEASGTISGRVFGVQGDAVERHHPLTSVAVIQNHDTAGRRRESPRGRTNALEESGNNPEVEHDGQAPVQDDGTLSDLRSEQTVGQSPDHLTLPDPERMLRAPCEC